MEVIHITLGLQRPLHQIAWYQNVGTRITPHNLTEEIHIQEEL